MSTDGRCAPNFRAYDAEIEFLVSLYCARGMLLEVAPDADVVASAVG